MVSLSTLRTVKPSDFEDAADGYHAVSSAASEAKDRLAQQIQAKHFPDPGNSSGGGLAGAGAAAASRRLERLAKNFHYAQVECGMVSAALNGFASELRAAKKKLTTAVEEAESAGFTVGDDGSVSWTADTPLPLEQRVTPQDSAVPLADPDPTRVKALGFADRIADALREATEADQKWGPKLEKLKAQNDLTVSAKDWANVHGDQRAVQKVAGEYLSKDDIPQGKSPRENAAWWNGLTDQEKADYVSLYPASVGALDGLPTEVRDEANRTVLAEKRGAYQVQLNNYPPPPAKYNPPDYQQTSRPLSNAWRDWRDRREKLKAQLDGMEDVQKRLDAGGHSGLPDAYLLGFGTEGHGRAIVAHGNPDTADHTAVYVPGTGSRLEDIQNGMGRSDSLWRESSKLAPGEDVSVVTWYGYEAPQSVTSDAKESHYANESAPAFNEFVNGIDTAHESGSESHTTVVSHSYGTTLVGSAARQGELNADDVVFAGSPGVQVGRAEDVDVPTGHVWNQHAKGDPVPEIGQPYHAYTEYHWRTGQDWVTPTDGRFGAHQMQTDTEGHSAYWDYQDDDKLLPTESLKNQSRVITGRYDEVTEAKR